MFRNKFTKLILILILLLPGGQVFAARQQAGANAWYVSPAGSDANSCLTPAEPCATLKGVVGKAAGGDTIKAAAGIYTGLNWEVVRVEKSLVISGGWNSDFRWPTPGRESSRSV